MSQATQITMQGNLVSDPQQFSTASGLTVTKFRLASNSRRFDTTTNAWVDGEAVFMSVSAWRRLGGNVMNSLRKGDTVIVSGRLTFREYDDKGGVRRQVYEIDAQSIGPDLGRFPVQVHRPQREPEFAPSEPAAGFEADAVPPQSSAASDPGASPWTERAAESAA